MNILPGACIDGVCAPMPGDGEPCFADRSCAEGAACIASTLVCVADAALGEGSEDPACAEDNWCSDNICASLLADSKVCYKRERIDANAAGLRDAARALSGCIHQTIGGLTVRTRNATHSGVRNGN